MYFIVLPCKKEWAFERVVGMELVNNDDLVMHSVPSRIECMQACLQEQSFLCRSAEYHYQTSDCRLSKQNRRTLPNAFRLSEDQVDYLENQCAPGELKNVLNTRCKNVLSFGISSRAFVEISRKIKARPCRGSTFSRKIHNILEGLLFQFFVDKLMFISPNSQTYLIERALHQFSYFVVFWMRTAKILIKKYARNGCRLFAFFINSTNVKLLLYTTRSCSKCFWRRAR